MKKFWAIVTHRETGEQTNLCMEYKTKKEFKEDIRRNGYSILNGFIYTDEEWNDPELFHAVSLKLNDRREIKNAGCRARKNANRRLKKLGIMD